MLKKLLKFKITTDQAIQAGLIYFLIIISEVSWLLSYKFRLTTTYNDAMSHLDIGRSVIDNIQPGLAQLGSVWLPLNHILMIPLVWNDWMWHSGMAGSLYSMISFVISGYFIYKIVNTLTKSRLSGIVGAIAFAVNLNILYLQTTPLTEPLYVVLFIITTYLLLKWFLTADIRYLIYLGGFGFLQVLIRYDGWFVVIMIGALIALNELIRKRRNYYEVLGKLILYSLPIIFGFTIWIVWNLVIFKDPLYFLIGPYSAHAQQSALQARNSLLTKGNLFISTKAYVLDIVDNVGLLYIFLSAVGTIYFLITSRIKLQKKKRILFGLALFSPVIFNILALFLGFSVINIPELHWNPSGNLSGQWFNVRYGILALPLISIFIGTVATSKKLLAIPIIALCILQQALIFQTGIITIIDGTVGSSSFANSDIALNLSQVVKPNQKILLSTAFFNAVAFKSNLPLSQFIYEGDSREWTKSLKDPYGYAQYIVAANGDIGDPVYNSLIKIHNQEFFSMYKLEYSGAHANIYSLRSTNEIFITRNGRNLMIGNKPFISKGVNSYDLVYRSNQEIENTFKDLNNIGVNTVRFWLFGDGNPDGLQPKAGVINEAQFQKVDLIIYLASKYNIKLIPVLVNNWDDYGGKDQYVKWVGKNPKKESDLFYTSPQIQNLYKNYINHVINRVNTMTGNHYYNEPSILSWDIMNEPRSSTNNNQIIVDWVKNISSYIKRIDTNHLITVGTEQSTGKISDGEAVDICSINNIDICSVHLYPYLNDKPVYSNPSLVQSFLVKQQSYSQFLNKPILLGEIGISKADQPFGYDPLNYLKDLTSLSLAYGYNGYLVWNWSVLPDNSFGFSEYGIYNLDTLKSLFK